MRVNARVRTGSSWLGMLLVVALVLGCPKQEEVIVKTAAGVELTAADIDRDPLALLPPSALGLLNVDAGAMFQSAFGQRLLQILSARLPVPPEAQFAPTRDLRRLYIGLYSMQGVDFAGVAVGSFNPEAIARAAEAQVKTPLGAPLTRSRYADRNLYVSNKVGFVVLTPSSVLFGNETGIRRALDRMQRGEIDRRVPAWFDELLATPNAAIAAGFDLASEPTVAAAAKSFPFLHRVETAKVLGNFQPPGMNFAGTLGYPAPEAALGGATELLRLRDTMQSLGFFTSLFGLGQPIQRLDAQAAGNDVRFVLALDGTAVSNLIEQLAGLLGLPQHVRASTSPAVQ